jgi:hypothetical protein
MSTLIRYLIREEVGHPSVTCNVGYGPASLYQLPHISTRNHNGVTNWLCDVLMRKNGTIQKKRCRGID